VLIRAKYVTVPVVKVKVEVEMKKTTHPCGWETGNGRDADERRDLRVPTYRDRNKDQEDPTDPLRLSTLHKAGRWIPWLLFLPN